MANIKSLSECLKMNEWRKVINFLVITIKNRSLPGGAL
jgi:hypothetical protein